MNITLSWDLFVIVFFIVIVAYSFIIGRDNTLKVILGTYVSIIAADAFGILFGLYFAGSPMFLKMLKIMAIGNEQEAIVFVKLLVFVLFVILFAIRGAFQVATSEDRSSLIRLILTIVYAVMSAGLIINAILIFISGVSFIAGSTETTTSALWGVYLESKLIRGMLSYRYLWFFLPALAFLIQSLYTKKEKIEE